MLLYLGFRKVNSQKLANPLPARAREGHKLHLQVALHRTGGHYPPVTRAITRAPPINSLLDFCTASLQSHLQY